MLRRGSFTWPIILAITLTALIVAMLVVWIVTQAAGQGWVLLIIGTILFLLILVGVVMYLVLSIKEINLSRRQANFIDSVTHELKSPIASIKLLLQTLELRPVNPGQQREFHRFMLEDVQRLDSLIDHLLTAARLEHNDTAQSELEDVPVVTVLQRCIEDIVRRYQLQPGQITLEATPCSIRGKLHDVEMVFSNLLDNAVKYGGKEPRVLVHAGLRTRSKVRIRVSDNGPGVRFEFRRHIFQRFFRGGDELERRTKGTGLGLYIVRQIVRQMRGSIHVHGRGPLRGATFDVDIPGQSITAEALDKSPVAAGFGVTSSVTEPTSVSAASNPASNAATDTASRTATGPATA